ncbi:MAG: arginine--tRNA ligase, partial [bacterium]|nr:arginine--tRNA ligase [bacterium]
MAAGLAPDELVASFQPAGPYLNLRLRRDAVASGVLRAVAEAAEPYGHSQRQQGEVVMMEYVSPNTNKPLHLGHIRNAVVGRAVANFIAAQGAGLHRTDIINDRGIHIAKSMIGYRRWGAGETPESAGDKGDHFVGRYYVRFERELQKQRQAWLERQGIDRSTLDDQEAKEVEARFVAESELMAE